MAATLKVTSIEKLNVQADNSTVLDVAFDILEDGQTLESRRLNFPLTHTKDQIQEELQNFINTFNADRELAAKNAALDAANAQADETIAALSDFEVAPNAEAAPAEPEAPSETSTTETASEPATGEQPQEGQVDPNAESQAATE